ncbi:MAG: hypothetical protein QUS08_08005 [Methanothrix sp.]|nr:hypothetical protein [Methanothrix sp.]
MRARAAMRPVETGPFRPYIEDMAWFAECDEQTGELVEDRLGDAFCPACGCPMLAKCSLEIVGP